nr:hypothetical transcript [Hymenolepis microstoma]
MRKKKQAWEDWRMRAPYIYYETRLFSIIFSTIQASFCCKYIKLEIANFAYSFGCWDRLFENVINFLLFYNKICCN